MNDLRAAIYALVGSTPDNIKDSGITRFSTSSRPGNRDGWVMPVYYGIFHFGCWRQGLTGSFSESGVLARTSQPRKPVFQLVEDIKLRTAKRVTSQNLEMWLSAFVLEPTGVVNKYLNKRGLNLPIPPDELRQASLNYFEDGNVVGVFPAMLAVVTSPFGEMVALHRTYLAADGTKAVVDNVKKLTRTSGPLAGASIKFGEPASVNGRITLGVAEGIETALACRLASGIPTWSCISAAGMQRFVWPVELQSLIIFADHDKSGVGQAAAIKLASRAIDAGLECRVLIPELIGSDWLDVYVQKANHER